MKCLDIFASTDSSLLSVAEVMEKRKGDKVVEQLLKINKKS